MAPAWVAVSPSVSQVMAWKLDPLSKRPLALRPWLFSALTMKPRKEAPPILTGNDVGHEDISWRITECGLKLFNRLFLLHIEIRMSILSENLHYYSFMRGWFKFGVVFAHLLEKNMQI